MKPNKPKYQLITDDLLGRVARGDLRVGERLPGTPDLEREYGASMQTVRRAQYALRDMGIIQIRPGLPTLIIAKPELEQAPEAPDGDGGFEALTTAVRELTDAVRELTNRLPGLEPNRAGVQLGGSSR